MSQTWHSQWPLEIEMRQRIMQFEWKIWDNNHFWFSFQSLAKILWYNFLKLKNSAHFFSYYIFFQISECNNKLFVLFDFAALTFLQIAIRTQITFSFECKEYFGDIFFSIWHYQMETFFEVNCSLSFFSYHSNCHLNSFIDNCLLSYHAVFYCYRHWKWGCRPISCTIPCANVFMLIFYSFIYTHARTFYF